MDPSKAMDTSKALHPSKTVDQNEFAAPIVVAVEVVVMAVLEVVWLWRKAERR